MPVSGRLLTCNYTRKWILEMDYVPVPSFSSVDAEENIWGTESLLCYSLLQCQHIALLHVEVLILCDKTWDAHVTQLSRQESLLASKPGGLSFLAITS